MRKNSFLQPNKEDHRKFKPLSGMHRHKVDNVFGCLNAVLFGEEGYVFKHSFKARLLDGQARRHAVVIIFSCQIYKFFNILPPFLGVWRTVVKILPIVDLFNKVFEESACRTLSHLSLQVLYELMELSRCPPNLAPSKGLGRRGLNLLEIQKQRAFTYAARRCVYNPFETHEVALIEKETDIRKDVLDFFSLVETCASHDVVRNVFFKKRLLNIS